MILITQIQKLNETKDIYNPIKKIPETVHSYGWYLNKFVTDIQEKGATPIILASSGFSLLAKKMLSLLKKE